MNTRGKDARLFGWEMLVVPLRAKNSWIWYRLRCARYEMSYLYTMRYLLGLPLYHNIKDKSSLVVLETISQNLRKEKKGRRYSVLLSTCTLLDGTS